MRPPLRLRLVPDRGFERIYRRHAAAVYVYALAMLGNPSDAEDVTRIILRNAYGAYAEGERPRAVQSWLLTIAQRSAGNGLDTWRGGDRS